MSVTPDGSVSLVRFSQPQANFFIIRIMSPYILKSYSGNYAKCALVRSVEVSLKKSFYLESDEA